jgi:dUTPase
MGLAKFKNLFSLAGIVDEDYRGNLGVVLFNHSDQSFNISRGDRIAQLICQRIYYPVLQEVKVSIINFCFTYCFPC